MFVLWLWFSGVDWLFEALAFSFMDGGWMDR